MDNQPKNNQSQSTGFDNRGYFEKLYNTKLTDLQFSIIEKWNNTDRNSKNLWSHPDIPDIPLKQAIDTYANMHDGEILLGFHDTTMRKSGKEGLVFTTEGVYYNNNGTKKNVKYSDIEPDMVTYKAKGMDFYISLDSKDDILTTVIPEDRVLSGLSSFVQFAATLTPSALPDECWDFIKDSSNSTAKPLIRFYSHEDIITAIKEHKIQSDFQYRHYNRKSVKNEEDKGEWMSIEPFIEELGLSIEEITKGEKKHNTKKAVTGTLLLVIPLAIFLAAVYTLIDANSSLSNISERMSAWGPGEWGGFVFGSLGVIAGAAAAFRRNSLFGLITLIVLIILLMRFCT